MNDRIDMLYASFKRSLEDMESPLNPDWIRDNDVSADELDALVAHITMILVLGDNAYSRALQQAQETAAFERVRSRQLAEIAARQSRRDRECAS